MSVAVGVAVVALAISTLNIGTIFDVTEEVSTEKEFQSYENTASNVVYTSGDLQLAGTNTSGSYTSTDLNASNSDTVEVYASIPDNATVSVVIQGYDDTDTTTSATSSVTLEDGRNTVDISGLGASTTDVQAEFSLSRDSGDVESGKVASFATGTSEDSGVGGFEPVLLIAVIGAGVMLVVRDFM